MYSADKIDIGIKEYSLEEHLEIKCKNNEKYKHLYAAWTTDKDIYTNSLSAVPVNFPHYSKHEASHSLSIVNKIEMVLGKERIKSLSPTDTFLILESAFSHDLGMIVTENLLRNEWKKPSFKRFLKRLSTDGLDEDIIKAAAYLLEIQEKNFEFDEKNKDWPIEVRDYVILITAEYFRKKHGLRSEMWLKQSEEIAACINGNKFIPERIMNIVGKIATAHGSDFDHVLNNLEHTQNGIGVDEIHPRFIACLIRLGDLLDLDNGRFSEVFEKTSPLPKSSQIHKEKHRSITHFLVSPERIEVSAVCESDAVYRETRLWFDWLSDELKNLSSKWSDIVPIGFKGGPPSLGDIKLSIKGAENITEQLNLRFNIDPVRAFELIEGNGIYRDELVFIRELLQNAMDATKIKIWKDIKSKKYDDIWGLIDSDFKDKVLSEYDFSFPRQLPQKLKGFYPIKINMDYEEAKDAIGENIYIFTIEDKGCGISLKDLKRMENVGGSWEQDDELQDFIETMPGWLQPTGSFGIGMHAVFLITDEIKIETKSDKEDGYNISFISRRKNGYITVKKDNSIANTGTKVTVRIKESKLKTIMQNRYIRVAYDYFDPNCKEKRIIQMLRKSIKEIIKNITTLNISLNLSYEKTETKKETIKNIITYGPFRGSDNLIYTIYLDKYITEDESIKKWNIEIQDKAYEIIVNLIVNDNKVDKNTYRTCREARFKEINCDYALDIEHEELFDIGIDIKKGKAKEVLEVSRDALKKNICKKYENRLNKIIIPEALRYLYNELALNISTDLEYVHKNIEEDVTTSSQLLKLRLAFNYFLNEENYMKEWGKDIKVGYNSEYTFGDLQESKYIIGVNECDIDSNTKEIVDKLKSYIGEDKCIYILDFYTIMRRYAGCEFGVIKRVPVKHNSTVYRTVRLRKRKQKISAFYINCLKDEEEAKEKLKILFDAEYSTRKLLNSIGYFKEENKAEILYKEIVISGDTEDLYNYGINQSEYFIFSPFKENCDHLIRLFNYDIDKVIELLKKNITLTNW
ncbi:hypothetical protein [Clostridium sp. OS1-26]|uniref:HD domain-containing protein n=1 Tax=Clostridium sp. OS1-26 TaxID=3070681 RepID=UPI0027E0C1D9|nr:hypothetical protein [Clostridium sp. OS1-26]WML32645.1 hypothetical protein RCG18_14815 [Clostridium sp. OS1-26]